MNSFAKKYNCKVQVTTFNTMNEALSKLRSGLKFDVLMGATVDVLGDAHRAEADPAAQPQLHPEHHPGMARLPESLLRPALAVHGPYTIYTTGIAWRKDKVHENPYTMAQPVGDALAAEVQGQSRDPRRLPRGHQPRPDEERHLRPQHHEHEPDRSVPAEALQNLAQTTNMQIDNNDYTQIPAGQIWIHHAWSGDIAAARSATCRKACPWMLLATGSPRTARALANDTNTVLRTATNPVLAHLFLNYMLDLPNVLKTSA